MRKDKVALIVDAERIRALAAQGMRKRDILLIVGGSRARLYRALACQDAESETHVTDSNERQETVSL